MAKENERFFPQGEYTQAVKFFRDKISLTTKKWTDLEGAMHQKAFTVAGIMRTEILTDFRNAVDKAVSENISLDDFRKEFEKIATKWQGRSQDEQTGDFDKRFKNEKYAAWRSRVIYQTNIQTAYTAGRERQARDALDKNGKPLFTHAKYVCMNLETSRKLHKAWDGTTLPVNHPWWKLHSPQNGWFCKCRKDYISKFEMDAGIEHETKAPTPPDSTEGIDKGWEHNIGDSAYAKYESQEAKRKAKYTWDDAPQKGNWMDDAPVLSPNAPAMQFPTEAPYTESLDEYSDHFMKRLKEEFSGAKNAKFYDDAVSIEMSLSKTTYPLYINPRLIGKHFLNPENPKKEWRPERTRFTNMIIEAIKNPNDCRLQFERSTSGLAKISAVFTTLFRDGRSRQKSTLVFKAVDGCLQIYTFYPSGKLPKGSPM